MKLTVFPMMRRNFIEIVLIFSFYRFAVSFLLASRTYIELRSFVLYFDYQVSLFSFAMLPHIQFYHFDNWFSFYPVPFSILILTSSIASCFSFINGNEESFCSAVQQCRP